MTILLRRAGGSSHKGSKVTYPIQGVCVLRFLRRGATAKQRAAGLLDAPYSRVMCELKESLGRRRVWVLNPSHATGGHRDDTELRGLVPDAVRDD